MLVNKALVLQVFVAVIIMAVIIMAIIIIIIIMTVITITIIIAISNSSFHAVTFCAFFKLATRDLHLTLPV